MATKRQTHVKAKDVVKRPVGRPSGFKSEYNDLAFKYCLLGATDAQLASNFGISEATLNNWKLEFPEFLESIARGREKADAEIAHSLYHRAKGAEWTEDVAFKCKRVEYEEGKRVLETEEIVTAPIRKAAPPDTPAASLWLRNRKSKFWRERHEVTGADGSPLQIIITAPAQVNPADQYEAG